MMHQVRPAPVQIGHSARPVLAKAVSGRPHQLEQGFAIIQILIVALLHSVSKLRYGEATDDSVLGEVVWTAMYAFAALRLWMLRDHAAPVLRNSKLLGLFLALTLSSMLWSIAPFVTFKSAVELLGSSLVGLYFVTRFTLAEFSKILAIAYSIICIVSLALVFGSPARGRADWGAGPFCGLFSDKNGLGLAMALATVTFSLTCLQSKGRRRWALMALLAMCIVLLVGSNSMTAVIVLLLDATLCAVLWAAQKKLFGLLVSMAVLVGGGVLLFFGTGMEVSQILSAFGRNANLTGRTEMWPGLLAAVGDQPLLGYGYNTFFGPDGPELRYIAGFVDQYGWVPPHAHNSFLQITLDTGIVGLLCFCFVLIVTLVKTITYYCAEGTLLSLWPFAMISFLILGSYDETYFTTANSLQWIFFTVAALYPISKREPAHATSDRATAISRA